MSKPPMTVAEALENVAAMRQHTPRNAAVKLLMLALGPRSNLSDGAREVYRAELARHAPPPPPDTPARRAG